MRTILFIAASLLLIFANPAFSQEKNVLGWVEWIIVEPGHLMVKAKLDTGAKTSSIRAKVTKEYKKDHETWITYEITDGKKASVSLDSKVVRWVKIKKKGKNAGFLRRPVVKLGFCIGGKLIEGEVNLSPRSGFLYPALIGRNMLKRHILIDTHKTYTTKPSCNQSLQ